MENTTTYSKTTFYLAFSAVCLIWGSTYLGVRFAIETLPPLLMAGVRFTIAGAIMFAWARLTGAALPTFAEARSAAIVGLMLAALCNGMMTVAMGRVPSSIGALIGTSLPIWMVLLDWLSPEGKRPHNGVFAGVALGFGGIILLVQPWKYFLTTQENAPHLDFIGIVLMFSATLAWAVGSIFARYAKQPESPKMTIGVQLLFGGIVLLFAAALRGDFTSFQPDAVSLKSFLAFLYLIFFGSIITFSAYSWLLQNVSAALASSYTYINPIVAILLGMTLGGESITATMLIAMVVILVAVGVIAKYRNVPVKNVA